MRKIRITDVTGAFYVFSKKGIRDEIVHRKTYGISFCESGKITYVQNGIKTVSQKNNVIFLPKGGTYKIIRQETGFFPVINFLCKGNPCDEILSFDMESGHTKITELFFRLRESILQKNPFLSLSLLYGILSEIFEAADKPSNAAKYIGDRLSDAALSNKSIADALNISESCLNKLFRKQYGISPKRYIIGKRIELAVRLLGENQYSIGQIYEKCGYSNPYSFSRAFKNERGVSPLEYKRMMQKQLIL